MKFLPIEIVLYLCPSVSKIRAIKLLDPGYPQFSYIHCFCLYLILVSDTNCCEN